MRVASHSYPPSDITPRRARRFVHTALDRWGMEQRHADLLTDEVVSDAVRHRPSQIALRLEADDEVLRVTVSDDPGVIPDPSSGRLERDIARRMLDALASRWGSTFDRDRTTTWFELSPDDHSRVP